MFFKAIYAAAESYDPRAAALVILLVDVPVWYLMYRHQFGMPNALGHALVNGLVMLLAHAAMACIRWRGHRASGTAKSISPGLPKGTGHVQEGKPCASNTESRDAQPKPAAFPLAASPEPQEDDFRLPIPRVPVLWVVVFATLAVPAGIYSFCTSDPGELGISSILQMSLLSWVPARGKMCPVHFRSC